MAKYIPLPGSNHARCTVCDDFITTLDSVGGTHPSCLPAEEV